MRNCYKILFVLFVVINFCWASSDDLDEASIKRFVTHLIAKGDYVAAEAFLSRFPSSDKRESVSAPMPTVTVPRDILRHAQARVFSTDQISLKTADILGNTPPSQSHRYVFEIDLSDDMSVDALVTIGDYFKGSLLCNLAWLTLPRDASLASNLVGTIFPNDDSQRKYISLHRVTVRGGLTEETLDTIFEHFLGYKSFVRDMSQISGRYDCVAAFLSVDGVRLEDGSKYARGRKDDGSHIIYYRVGEAPTEDAPFIISVGR